MLYTKITYPNLKCLHYQHVEMGVTVGLGHTHSVKITNFTFKANFLRNQFICKMNYLADFTKYFSSKSSIFQTMTLPFATTVQHNFLFLRMRSYCKRKAKQSAVLVVVYKLHSIFRSSPLLPFFLFSFCSQ